MAIFEVPAESRKRYLTRRLEEIAKLEESHELEFAKKVGHQIKGNAATFLFPALTELGSELESAAIAADESLIETKVFELKVMVQKLLVEF